MLAEIAQKCATAAEIQQAVFATLTAVGGGHPGDDRTLVVVRRSTSS